MVLTDPGASTVSFIALPYLIVIGRSSHDDRIRNVA